MFQSKRQKNNTAKKLRIPFTSEEDKNIIFCVSYVGTKNWGFVSNFVKGRTPKQCRDRYMNYLKPEFSHTEWTQKEDKYLLELYEKNGPKWCVISKYLKNRNQISIKNRFMFLRKTDNTDSKPKNNGIIINSSINQDILQEKINNEEMNSKKDNLSEEHIFSSN
ncbi:hypothetical protein M9Y10_000560 [Tritrichomonas musculus]|uniref:Myb-like DNA-binding domain containing protein n=1 Tax=Tritrichomonas musculus TaxID=1915356 RepID=A0ABR2L5J3_9EUKA